MFNADYHPLQRGRGNFHVDRFPLQRGRGLGGLFASMFQKILPFGKSFLKAGKNIIQSETGKSILNDTINSAASAATTALLENNPEEAKQQMIKSLKRSGNKTKHAVGKIAKNKLEKVLTGKGNVKSKSKRRRKNMKKKNITFGQLKKNVTLSSRKSIFYKC